MSFYLTYDTKLTKFFIAPQGKVDIPYLIEFPNRYEAEKVLKKLNAQSLKPPIAYGQEDGPYILIETVSDVIFKGEVSIFKLR